jgi:general nucleoside transport system permease protein
MFLEDVLAGAVRSSTSVVFAAQGEVIAERSGVVNLGVEGSMLAGALAGYAVTAETGVALIGVAAGAAAGAALALVHAVLVLEGRANQLASGLAVFFLGLGVTAALGHRYVDLQIEPLEVVPVPLLSDLPFVGRVVFNHDLLTYCALALGPLLWLFLYRTRWGLILLATGERGDVAFAYGHAPRRVRYLAVLTGGALAGVGGAQLVLAYAQIWIENVTVGRGFVAIALVIFAAWDPLKATVGGLVYGFALSFQLQLQARGVDISAFLLDMTPYLLTLAVLVVASRRWAQRAPEGLSAVFGRARG